MYSTVPTTVPPIVCAAVAARLAPAGNVPAAPPAGGPDGGPGDAEVHHQALAVGVDHDVGRLEVAVHDAGLVARRPAPTPRCGR